ncbi:50S ribosomal protein L4 [Dechloromonas sp. ZS-1]|jgi:large subunit ribosomal protein L4|uniref:50S ribosomal protein L4 n=1 Tax=Dechloromonas sp. ZS-1 TaxID=3138067 RepID=UPI0031FDBD93
MELKVINEQGQEAAKLQASDILFAREFNESLVHQLVVAYQANARSADSKQKDRSEVRHTTTKPWRQKGTGRARSGSNGSPLWRGGGRIFPNSPDQNYSQKVNKKMFRAGMAAILSELARQDRLVVCEDLSVDAPKTKLFAQKLKGMGLEGNLLVVTDELSENLYLSSRNLPNVLVLEAQEADPVSLVRFNKVLVTKSAVAKFEEMWG